MAAVIPFPAERLTRSESLEDSCAQKLGDQHGSDRLRAAALRHIERAIQHLEDGNEEERRISWILEDCIQLLGNAPAMKCSGYSVK